jgi:hypothetical protein
VRRGPDRERARLYWTDTWYSEEQGWYLTYGSEAIAGFWCSGSYCDNKKYYVCTAG